MLFTPSCCQLSGANPHSLQPNSPAQQPGIASQRREGTTMITQSITLQPACPVARLVPFAAARCARSVRRNQLRRNPAIDRSHLCRAQQTDSEEQNPPPPAASEARPVEAQGPAEVGSSTGSSNGNGSGSEEQAQQDASLQLPQDVIQRLRTTVFSFDTFFVTSVENYQADGVLFRGNLRGDPAVAYQKLSTRLKEELGDQYVLYLLENQESKPVAVVLPVSAVLPQTPAVSELALALLFGATTLLTTVNINGGELFNFALLTFNWDPEAVQAALPGTAALLAILAVHELGHSQAARQRGVELAPPLLIPAGLGLLGSFGAITRIKSIVPSREALAAVAAAGPVYSAALSAGIMLAGAALSAKGIGGVELAVDSFRESLLAGALGQAVFGSTLFEADAVDTNPLFVAGWAGLIINAINMLPAGELDGGRTFLGLFGRRAASRMGAVTLLLLGLLGFTNSLALFWLLLVLTLQRGPVVPCENELSPIQDPGTRNLAIAALLLPLLVLLPYPLALDILPDPNQLAMSSF